VTDHEQRRLAALHEYRLLDARAIDELEAVGLTTVTFSLPDA
jgi:hypothetical protein